MIRRLLHWLVSRLPPPRVIFDRAGRSPYLSRWYVFGGARDGDGGEAFDRFGNPKRTAVFTSGVNVFVHRFHRGDDDVALHNHPWHWAISIVLAGGYTEERRYGDKVARREVRPPAINLIRAQDFHRVDLLEEDCWSIFIAGPRAGSWGFWDRDSGQFWPWREFISLVRGPGWDAAPPAD